LTTDPFEVIRSRFWVDHLPESIERRPNCGGELKIIAATPEQPVIEKILTHLGVQARAPPRSPAWGQALHAA